MYICTYIPEQDSTRKLAIIVHPTHSLAYSHAISDAQHQMWMIPVSDYHSTNIFPFLYGLCLPR